MAAMAHAGQKIKHTDAPFISHPFRVALAVMLDFGCTDEEVIAAALLHDTLEKTPLPAQEIDITFGPRVLYLVNALTKENEADEANYWNRLTKASWEARLIKIADALDHLDCPIPELPKRIGIGRKALSLTYSGEAPLLRARRILKETLRSVELRMNSYS